MTDTCKIKDKDIKQEQNKSAGSTDIPKTLFGLLVYILKNILSPKGLVKRIVIALISGVIILILHTYLLVVLNEGFGAGNNKILNYIIAVDVSGETADQRNVRMLSVNLFWALLGCLFWGTIARIRFYGVKVYILSVLNGFLKLIEDFFEKAGSAVLSLFLTGIIFGLGSGIFIGNPLAAILMAAVIFTSVSAGKGSFIILVTYLAWGDYQRFFNVNPRRAFYIDIVSCVLRGISLGLILYSVFPFVRNGQFAGFACLFFLICLLILNMRIKVGKTFMPIFIAAASMIFYATVKVYADDGGWSESGGTLDGWVKSGGADEAVDRGVSSTSWWVSMALGFIPFIGDAKDVQETTTGVDLITGEKLAGWERFLTGGAMFLPIINGKVVREGAKAGGKAAKGFFRKLGELLGILKKQGDDVAETLMKKGEDIGKGTAKKIESKIEGNLANQTREQLMKSKQSYEQLIQEHKSKLEEYIRNPEAFDNKGILKNAPTPEIRQKIIDGRINQLQKQINKQQGELNKINELLK